MSRRATLLNQATVTTGGLVLQNALLKDPSFLMPTTGVPDYRHSGLEM
jgi:hypothetical protein